MKPKRVLRAHGWVKIINKCLDRMMNFKNDQNQK